jgi:CO dehydrogenase/acetyl-CoA synthase delta subunit
MTNSRQKMVTFNEGQLQKLNDLISHYSLMGISEAVRFAINMTHESAFKYQRSKYVPSSPEEKATRSVETQTLKQKMKQEAEDAEWKALVTALNGTISEDAVGNKYCKWTTYALLGQSVSKFEQELPVNQLSQVLVDNQYDPNRERVEAILASQSN